MDAERPTAGVLPRGMAYCVDCGCVFVLFAVSQLLIFAPIRTALGITNDWFRSGLNTEIYTLVTISIPVWLYFAILESSPGMATIGKRSFGIRVVSAESQTRIGLMRALARTVIKLVPWELAHLGNNLPNPIWYSEDPGFRMPFLFSAIVMGIYIVMVCTHSRRQCVHDIVADTLVVKSAVP